MGPISEPYILLELYRTDRLRVCEGCQIGSTFTVSQDENDPSRSKYAVAERDCDSPDKEKSSGDDI